MKIRSGKMQHIHYLERDNPDEPEVRGLCIKQFDRDWAESNNLLLLMDKEAAQRLHSLLGRLISGWDEKTKRLIDNAESLKKIKGKNFELK